MPTCDRCHDHRWVCMAHPDQPFPHEDCTAGLACPACNTADPPQGMPGFERSEPVGADGDPALTLNCPYCGAQLTYVRTERAGTEGETFVFRCARHGVLILPPEGRIRQQPA